MNTQNGSVNGSAPVWFVGASFGHTENQVERFLSEGVWEIRQPGDRDMELVRSMRPGERIAIKAAYVRKRNLPFDNRGQSVAVMAIKATGIIVSNPQDGERVRVQWQPVGEAREWYFYTYQRTIWRVEPGAPHTDALIAFAFEGRAQDLDYFRNEPFWRDRFGTSPSITEEHFQWTDFYEEMAEKLRAYKDDRTPLIAELHAIASRISGLDYLQDKFPDGTRGPLRDICPFTVMGTFNRGIRDANRKVIAEALGKFLGITAPVPTGFDGLPLLDNRRSWFFRFADQRGVHDIDALWAVFDAGCALSEAPDVDAEDTFIDAYDKAIQLPGVAWNLSTGLFWAHPWTFPTLDSQSRRYLDVQLAIEVRGDAEHGPIAGRTLLKLAEDLSARFEEADYPVHSFPELSLAAWEFKEPTGNPPLPTGHDVDGKTDPRVEDQPGDTQQKSAPIIPYSVDDVLKDGCFLARADIDRLLHRLRAKKNLILQGPPGTGKTWLAKRLAFALIGQKDGSKVRAVQFHPNLSYEDFVRGWRPTGEGKLSLVDGVFMEAIKAAAHEPSAKFAVVIEEINRGNPAQIFGELLTLLEAGKRTPNDALELCYPDADGKRRPVHIPENLYVVGTMNVADRSLALVDMALRRRFAFVELEPTLGPAWRDWVIEKCGVDAKLAADIERRITQLNTSIAGDPHLGKQFRVGHSYVMPVRRLEEGVTKAWFEEVVMTEISPLLDEYWFDAPSESQKATAALLQGW